METSKKYSKEFIKKLWKIGKKGKFYDWDKVKKDLVGLN